MFDLQKWKNSDLYQWLHSAPLPEDFKRLPWNPSVLYMPIEIVRSKFEIIQNTFNGFIEQTEVTTSAINTFDKDTLISACVKFNFYHELLPNGKMMLSGTASFLKGQYNGGWAYTQIAESLSISRTFSKEWKQFGKGINQIDSISDLKSPSGSKSSSAIKDTFKNA